MHLDEPRSQAEQGTIDVNTVSGYAMSSWELGYTAWERFRDFGRL